MAGPLESCTLRLSLDLAEDGDVLDVSGTNYLRTIQVDSVYLGPFFSFLYSHPIVNKDSNILKVSFFFIEEL